MAKKSFKDNPALMFISGSEQEEQTEEREASAEPKTRTTAKAPEGYKLNPLYIETKSKRLQLVLQPSVLERVKAAAKAKGLSVNEYCHQILDEATRREE